MSLLRQYTVICECGESRTVEGTVEPALEWIFGPMQPCSNCAAPAGRQNCCARKCESCREFKCLEHMTEGTACLACDAVAFAEAIEQLATGGSKS